MNRRHFNRICSSLLLATSSGQAIRAAEEASQYKRSTLYRDKHTPLHAADLEPGQAYLFFYPFVTTPCFLIDIDTPLEPVGHWPGGIGPNRSIVAYSAICSHKMSHPAKEISFINYRHDEVEYYNRQGQIEKQAKVISCCSERSLYNPAQGAQVLSGPAPQPLATIVLEYDTSLDQITATGSNGANRYDDFFKKFGFRASLEHKTSNVQAASAETVIVQAASEYSRQTITC